MSNVLTEREKKRIWETQSKMSLWMAGIMSVCTSSLTYMAVYFHSPIAAMFAVLSGTVALTAVVEFTCSSVLEEYKKLL